MIYGYNIINYRNNPIYITNNFINKINQKERKENPLKLIIAFMIMLIGLYFLFVQIYENWNITKSNGIVVDYREYTHLGEIQYWPIIEFNADGEKHRDDYPFDNTKMGDKLIIYYDEDYDIVNPTNNNGLWISAFIISLLLVLSRFKKKKKQFNLFTYNLHNKY